MAGYPWRSLLRCGMSRFGDGQFLGAARSILAANRGVSPWLWTIADVGAAREIDRTISTGARGTSASSWLHRIWLPRWYQPAASIIRCAIASGCDISET